ncbi:hypothetical protein, partial [Mycobacteroides abscessus]
DRTGGHPRSPDCLNHHIEESHDDVVHHVPGLDRDVEGFIPYLTERWPPNGRPHHVELLQVDGRKPPPGVDGWIVFRLAAPEQEPDSDGGPAIDWDAVLQERLADRHPTDEE